MANPSVTYTFTNGNVADASQVNQNFTDIINSLIDGTKSLSIDALTVGGLLSANGNVDLGNAAGDSISVTGFVDTNITMKSVDAGASAGPDLIIDRDSASAADGDAIGRVIFRGNDDAGTPADNDYASIEASIVDSGAGSEDGKLDIKITESGTSTSYITAESTKGVALKGRTDGQPVASGYVGETYQDYVSMTRTSNAAGDGSTRTLQTGRWKVTVCAACVTGTGTEMQSVLSVGGSAGTTQTLDALLINTNLAAGSYVPIGTFTKIIDVTGATVVKVVNTVTAYTSGTFTFRTTMTSERVA